jgi:hypothetical protein
MTGILHRARKKPREFPDLRIALALRPAGAAIEMEGSFGIDDVLPLNTDVCEGLALRAW